MAAFVAVVEYGQGLSTPLAPVPPVPCVIVTTAPFEVAVMSLWRLRVVAIAAAWKFCGEVPPEKFTTVIDADMSPSPPLSAIVMFVLPPVPPVSCVIVTTALAAVAEKSSWRLIVAAIAAA